VPARGLDGAPFTGAGVDLRGDDAARVIAAAAPIVAWLGAREPGVVVRSISVVVDHARTGGGPRVLVSLEALERSQGDRPRALRFEGVHAEELREAGRVAEELLGSLAAAALARRS
jgi:hypothetical protein